MINYLKIVLQSNNYKKTKKIFCGQQTKLQIIVLINFILKLLKFMYSLVLSRNKEDRKVYLYYQTHKCHNIEK